MRSAKRTNLAVWILALAVIAGTSGVWWEPLHELVMCRSVTEYFANGQPQSQTLWKREIWKSASDGWSLLPYKTSRWDEDGQLTYEHVGTEHRTWDQAGRLREAFCFQKRSGVLRAADQQTVYLRDQVVHTATAPPWLTEKQIERALNGNWP